MILWLTLTKLYQIQLQNILNTNNNNWKNHHQFLPNLLIYFLTRKFKHKMKKCQFISLAKFFLRWREAIFFNAPLRSRVGVLTSLKYGVWMSNGPLPWHVYGTLDDPHNSCELYVWQEQFFWLFIMVFHSCCERVIAEKPIDLKMG